MANIDVISPIEVDLRWRRLRRLCWLLALLLVVVGYFYWRFNRVVPVGYENDVDHFKYGSIGAERGHLPYLVWQVLPEVFPEHLPADRPGVGYEKFGFIQEQGRPTPIGFSRLHASGVDLVGLNCGACHIGTVRASAEATPQVVLGMPAHQLDVLAYFQFLFRCAQDERFNERVLLPAIKKHKTLGPIDRLIYHTALQRTRDGVLQLKWRLRYLDAPENFGLFVGSPANSNEPQARLQYPLWGPGRVDTTNIIKAARFRYDMSRENWVSTNELPSLWNQAPRRHMGLHWDGNNSSLDERNLSAALGAGAHPDTVDKLRIDRVAAWAQNLPPPKYPFPIDGEQATKGKQIYVERCYKCHDFAGSAVGETPPIAETKTDPHRLNSATPAFFVDVNKIGSTELNHYEIDPALKTRKHHPWRFSHFSKTPGYVNVPLDGVWARAPYLHNGSVPTMRDLLKLPGQRPTIFYKGTDIYDQMNMGFITAQTAMGNYFRFDITLPGNSNSGHEYGTDLSDEQITQLIEYMKQL